MTLDPENRFAFVCDLGLDRVMAYRFDGAKGKLTAHNPASVSVKPGAGPRHMVFRPDGRFAYVLNELDSTVMAFAYDAKAGALKELQTLRTLPEHYDGPNSCAEVDIHPSGKFLYASNRGHNSVVLFGVDPDKGTFTFVEEQGTGGKTPRHFGIEPVGQAPGHRQPGIGQRAGLPHRRGQRTSQAVGRVRRGAHPRSARSSCPRPERADDSREREPDDVEPTDDPRR